MKRSARRPIRLHRLEVAGLIAAGFVFLALSSLDPFVSAYRLQVIEPQEGASVPRGQVRVTVQLEARGEAGAAPKDATPAPAPKVEIYLDNQSKGALSEGQNTLTIEGVPAGAHTLVVTASDPGGAVIEKKVIHFAALPPSPQ